MDRKNKLQFSDMLLLAHDYSWWKQEHKRKEQETGMYSDNDEIMFMTYIWDLLDVQKVKDYIKDMEIDFDVPAEENEDTSTPDTKNVELDLDNCEEAIRYKKKKKGDK